MVIATVLRRSFWLVYDHLGRLVLGHLLWLLLASPFLLGAVWLSATAILTQHLIILAVAWFALLAVILASPATFGFLGWLIAVSQEHSEDLGHIWVGFRRFFWKGCALIALLVLANSLIFVNAMIYVTQFSLPPWMKVALLSFLIWTDILLWGIASYLPILFVHQSMNWRDACSKAFLLFLDNPGLTFWLILATLVITLISMFSGVGLILFLVTLVSALQWNTFQVLIEKYETVEQLQQEGRTPSRRLVRQRLRDRWTQEPQRGWRDLFKPWE